MAYADPGAVTHAAPAAQFVQQPAVFNCPPEIFAKLAQGGALTPEEMAMLSGGAAPAPVEVAAAAPVAVAEAVTSAPAPAVSSATSSKKKSSKKKALSS